MKLQYQLLEEKLQSGSTKTDALKLKSTTPKPKIKQRSLKLLQVAL
jgi:hypothetical protein